MNTDTDIHTDSDSDSDDRVALISRLMTVMAEGRRADFASVYHPQFTNRMAGDEPAGARGTGPDAAWATARWLREAYSDLRWEIESVSVVDDLVITYGTMCGLQTGPFTTYAPDATVARVFPPTGRRFRAAQAHFFRVRDGLVVEHWAVRDDLGQAAQLGWIPPSLGFLLRSAVATRRARSRR